MPEKKRKSTDIRAIELDAFGDGLTAAEAQEIVEEFLIAWQKYLEKHEPYATRTIALITELRGGLPDIDEAGFILFPEE